MLERAGGRARVVERNLFPVWSGGGGALIPLCGSFSIKFLFSPGCIPAPRIGYGDPRSDRLKGMALMLGARRRGWSADGHGDRTQRTADALS